MQATPLHVVLGAGPVGWAIATELADRGAAVRVVTRSGSGPEHRRIERVALDVSSTAGAIAGCADAAVVYGAAHMPAVLAELRRHGAFRPVDSAWLEAIPL